MTDRFCLQALTATVSSGIVAALFWPNGWVMPGKNAHVILLLPISKPMRTGSTRFPA